MRTIFSRVKLNGKQVTGLFLLILAASVAEMMLPTLLASMIDVGVADSRKGYIGIMTIVMAALALITYLTNLVATRISARVSTKFAADLRKEIFYQVQSLSAAEMDKFGTASLVTRNTSDVTNVQTFFSSLLRLGVMAPLMAIAGLILASVTGGRLSVVLLVAVPMLVIAVGTILALNLRISVKMRTKMDRLNTLFLEALEGVRVIRAFNKQEYEIARFADMNTDYTKTAIASSRISGALMPAINACFGVTMTGVMGLGSRYVSNGEMEIGALVANSQYITMILTAVILLATVLMLFPMANACANRIAEVLNTESSIRDGHRTLSDKTLSGTVEFRHVSFSYPNAEEPVIRDISFLSRPGEFTAIIGRTGCGKTSLLELIPRLYDPTEGQVLIDGIEAKDYRLNDLRSIIGYVPQKNVLFSGDVASNLNYGKENGTDADWKEAADIACASEFIERKDGGYHTEIVQGGSNLSGGQRQRMAIARAVMKKPEIYLFDDSFSALDMKTDRELRSNLRRNLGAATVIMVAQRISTIINADRILVLEKGEIVGNGTHEELLRTCPLYREIAVLQLGEEAVGHEE